MEQQGKPLSEEELKNIELRTELFNRYILPNKNLVYRLCIRYTYLQENIADNYSEALVNFSSTSPLTIPSGAFSTGYTS